MIEQITDQHAVIINRNREASMVLPGETLLVYEVTPALFAAVAANAAERVAPEATLVTVSMIGAAAASTSAAPRERRARADEIAGPRVGGGVSTDQAAIDRLARTALDRYGLESDPPSGS